jgi:hypothetical protein
MVSGPYHNPTGYNAVMTRSEEKEKFWQFSLRFLLTLMFLVATFCGGWVAKERHRERSLRELRAGVFKINDGGWVHLRARTNDLLTWPTKNP